MTIPAITATIIARVVNVPVWLFSSVEVDEVEVENDVSLVEVIWLVVVANVGD
jgi:ribulose 1,5-bisphosphate synthetase/thiazole synthase